MKSVCGGRIYSLHVDATVVLARYVLCVCVCVCVAVWRVTYYQQLHLKYLCNLEMYWLQAPRGWHDRVETCRSLMVCEIIVHLLVIIQKKIVNRSYILPLLNEERVQHYRFWRMCKIWHTFEVNIKFRSFGNSRRLNFTKLINTTYNIGWN